MRSIITISLALLASLSLHLNTMPKTYAQAAEGAEIAQTDIPEERPAPGTETFGQTQFILAGDPLVPPREYSNGTSLPRAQDHDPMESGKIYDIRFLGLQSDQMQFEIRGYSISDLKHPATGQILEFSVAQQIIEIRDLIIKIEEATADSLTYMVLPLR